MGGNVLVRGAVLAWMPRFMEQTEGESLIGAYRCLARLGARYLRELDSLMRESGR